MDFEVEVIPVPTGNAILKQKYSGFVVENIMKLRLSHVLVLAMWIYLLTSHGTKPTLEAVAPSASVFYLVRTIVDYTVGTRWRTYDI